MRSVFSVCFSLYLFLNFLSFWHTSSKISLPTLLFPFSLYLPILIRLFSSKVVICHYLFLYLLFLFCLIFILWLMSHILNRDCFGALTRHWIWFWTNAMNVSTQELAWSRWSWGCLLFVAITCMYHHRRGERVMRGGVRRCDEMYLPLSLCWSMHGSPWSKVNTFQLNLIFVFYYSYLISYILYFIFHISCFIFIFHVLYFIFYILYFIFYILYFIFYIIIFLFDILLILLSVSQWER